MFPNLNEACLFSEDYWQYQQDLYQYQLKQNDMHNFEKDTLRNN